MEVNANIIRIINNHLKIPAFILDQHGELLTLNENARKLYSPVVNSISFWEIFCPESISLVKKTFNESLNSNRSLVESGYILQTNNDKKSVEFTFSGIGENGNKLILCTFDFAFSNTGKLKLTIKADELGEIIKSDAFLSILEEIRSSFPFTLLGKAKIRNEVNKLEDYFWLKDPDGKYLLVNNKYAMNLGLKAAQIEGKYEKEFLPKYLSTFFKSLDEFLQNTTNIVIREGITQPISSEHKNLRVIEFPLCDLDNKAIAIIGFAQNVVRTAGENNNQSETGIENLLKALDYPSALLNNSGDIQLSNQSFIEIISNFSNVEKEILETEIRTQCENLNSSSELLPQIKKSFKVKNVSFVFNIRKLYNCIDEFSKYLLQVNKYSEEFNTEVLLNNREKMYEIIMQASPEPMYIYDIENLRFLEVNKAALDMYGYSRNEFLQMDLTDLYAPEDIQTLLDSGSNRSKEGIFTGPWRHKKRDGSSILVEISKVSFEYKSSKAHFNIIRDVTEKIEMNKELQLYKNIFDNTSDIIFITDTEGFITFANHSALMTLDYSRDELDNRPLITLVTDDFRSELSSVYYSAGEVNSLSKVQFKRKEGGLINLDLLFTPVFDYNEQIVTYNILAKIVKDINFSSTDQNGKLSIQTSPGIDTTLLSSMFHEILTPINVILGFVQEITDNVQDPSEEMKEATEIISQNRQVLLQTMDSVLEYSHIEQKRIELKSEKIFFTDILDTLQKNTKKIAETNKIEFSYGKISSSLNIETDIHRLESLLTIFINGAMKITKEKTIYISAYQYDDQNYIISIKDNRRSITDYLADSLKQVFSTDIKEIKKDYGISKLSIHLAKKLINLLNGRFEIIKKAGDLIECGFVFPLVLPVEDTDGVPVIENKEEFESKKEPELIKEEIEAASISESILVPVEKVQAEPSIEEPEIIMKPAPIPLQVPEVPVKIQKTDGKVELSGLKCLYVEDQIDSQILFKVQMKDLKNIDFAVSFEAALPLLEQNKYDFIIMDINLQGEYNGLDALRIIRRLPAYIKTQIIAVTAYVLPGDKEKFIAAGFNDFISKPILREKLLDSLNKILI